MAADPISPNRVTSQKPVWALKGRAHTMIGVSSRQQNGATWLYAACPNGSIDMGT
jgi:hypothetical protein